LGLGLLSGNPFNKWGNAMRGYQTGAAQDLTRQGQVNQYGYQQQELAVRREQMAQALSIHREEMQRQRDLMRQQYEIAMKPQAHFVEQWDPVEQRRVTKGYLHYPATGEIRPMKLDEGGGTPAPAGGATVHTPNGPVRVPPGVDLETFAKERAKEEAKYQAGAGTVWQSIQRWFRRPSEEQTQAPTQSKPPSRPQNVPADAIAERSNKGRWRWRSGSSFWDERGTRTSEYVR
jgi:hypothetical protein